MSSGHGACGTEHRYYASDRIDKESLQIRRRTTSVRTFSRWKYLSLSFSTLFASKCALPSKTVVSFGGLFVFTSPGLISWSVRIKEEPFLDLNLYDRTRSGYFHGANSLIGELTCSLRFIVVEMEPAKSIVENLALPFSTNFLNGGDLTRHNLCIAVGLNVLQREQIITGSGRELGGRGLN
jgi:hypothetical protein